MTTQVRVTMLIDVDMAMVARSGNRRGAMACAKTPTIGNMASHVMRALFQRGGLIGDDIGGDPTDCSLQHRELPSTVVADAVDEECRRAVDAAACASRDIFANTGTVEVTGELPLETIGIQSNQRRIAGQ
jgi:hypothetical protein